MYRYFFSPNIFHKIIIFLLLPFSFLYYLIAIFRKKYGEKLDFGIKIISIGNIVSGGSGKTPFCISLVKNLESNGFSDIFVILRGYKRKSKGLKIVKYNGDIISSVKESGDEAMLIAENIRANVIVSENRFIAIQKAKDLGAKIIILDDAFRFSFVKFDILLEPCIKPFYNFTLPSGYYRFPISFYNHCNLHLLENKDYFREVKIENIEQKMLLITAIANPARLDGFLKQYEKNIIKKIYLADHANLDEMKMKELCKKYDCRSILMTQKDYVKCKNFNLTFSVMNLNLIINDNAMQKIYAYLKELD